jgi:hypothetical protein
MDKTLGMKRTLALTCLIIALGLSVSVTKTAKGASQSGTDPATNVPLIYMSPSTIVGTTVGQNFSAYMMMKYFSDLYGWQAGLNWNPAVLNLTSVDIGDTLLPNNVFHLLDPTVPNAYIPTSPVINNVAGTLGYMAQALSGVVPGVNASDGTGYYLMKLNFIVVGAGVSDLHLAYTKIINSALKTVALDLLDVFTAVYPSPGGTQYPVQILTNSTGTSSPECGISKQQFIQAHMTLNFTVTISTTVAKYGFCNVTIPKTLMSCATLSNWVVKINGASPLSFPTPTANATHTFIYFTYNQPSSKPYTLNVQIISTSAVPEFSAATTLPLLMIISLIAVILGKLRWSKKPTDRIIA